MTLYTLLDTSTLNLNHEIGTLYFIWNEEKWFHLIWGWALHLSHTQLCNCHLVDLVGLVGLWLWSLLGILAFLMSRSLGVLLGSRLGPRAYLWYHCSYFSYFCMHQKWGLLSYITHPTWKELDSSMFFKIFAIQPPPSAILTSCPCCWWGGGWRISVSVYLIVFGVISLCLQSRDNGISLLKRLNRYSASNCF